MKISVVAFLLISLIISFNLLAMATPLPPAPAPSPSDCWRVAVTLGHDVGFDCTRVSTNIVSKAVSFIPRRSNKGFCDKKCGVRCALKGRQSRCMKFCMMCCGRCNCVPSGTFGNKDECPCYRDWISPNGRPKCP